GEPSGRGFGEIVPGVVTWPKYTRKNRGGPPGLSRAIGRSRRDRAEAPRRPIVEKPSTPSRVRRDGGPSRPDGEPMGSERPGSPSRVSLATLDPSGSVPSSVDELQEDGIDLTKRSQLCRAKRSQFRPAKRSQFCPTKRTQWPSG